MMTPRLFLLTAALFSTFAGVPSAQAARQISLPAYTRRVISNHPVRPDGTPIAIILTAQVNLTNMSNVVQTGTIQLSNGSAIGATQVGRGQYNRHIWVCTNAANDSSTGSLPLNAAWSLPPGGTATSQVGAVFYSTYNAAGPSGHSQADATLMPVIRIVVNEDRGAIMGTLIPQVDGPVPGYVTCGGFDLTPYSSGTLPDERSGVPLLINGGRPF